MNKLQSFGRVFFRAYVIAMLTLSHNGKAFWGIPLGIIIGMLSEYKTFSGK